MNTAIPSIPRWPALPLALLVFASSPAPATVTIDPAFSGSFTEVNDTAQLAYAADVSATDLLHGLTATVATGWNPHNGATPANLNDGTHGTSFDDVGAASVATIAWTTVGAIAEYELGTGANGLGYDITSIQSIADWNGAAFGNQGYTVEVKPVGGSYALLATVDYQPLGGAGGTKVTLTSLDASGIEFIKFTATSVNGGANGGAFTFREIDVVGTDTVAGSDLTPPTLDTLTSAVPADGATGVTISSNLEATFSEVIALTGSGTITLKNLSGGADIPIALPADVTVSGAVLTIFPASNLVGGNEYAVEISSDAIEDLSGNSFAGILDTTTWAFTTSAVVITTVMSGPNAPSTTDDELTYAGDVSSSDLLHGIVGTGGAWLENGSSPDGLNDGDPGGDFDDEGLPASLNGATWASDGDGVSFREFELGVGSGQGFDITGIQSIAAWQGAGFSNQKYEVRVRLVGETEFPVAPLLTVDYQPFPASPLNNGGSTKVNVTSATGLLASGVEAIRFDILDTISNPAGGTVFREIDVFGAQTGSSTFALTIAQNGANLDFTWASQSGMLYRLRSSADLTADFATWDLVGEDLPATAPLGSISIPKPGDDFLFYRMEEYPNNP